MKATIGEETFLIAGVGVPRLTAKASVHFIFVLVLNEMVLVLDRIEASSSTSTASG